MIHLTHATPILLGVAPADFRCGIDGFAARTRQLLGRDPADGTLYVYINRARTRVRAIAYDGSGYWLLTKRLSKGRFAGWPVGEETVSVATACALRALLQGANWSPASTAAAAAKAPAT